MLKSSKNHSYILCTTQWINEWMNECNEIRPLIKTKKKERQEFECYKQAFSVLSPTVCSQWVLVVS